MAVCGSMLSASLSLLLYIAFLFDCSLAFSVQDFEGDTFYERKLAFAMVLLTRSISKHLLASIFTPILFAVSSCSFESFFARYWMSTSTLMGLKENRSLKIRNSSTVLT